jgi:hypothetical protein
MTEPQYLERFGQYLNLRRRSVKIKAYLGEGTDGAVWATDDSTAVKVFWRARGYYNERDSYQRLADFGVTQ